MSGNNESGNGGGTGFWPAALGFWALCGAVFIALKLAGAVGWGWAVTLAPLWVTSGTLLCLAALTVAAFVIEEASAPRGAARPAKAKGRREEAGR